MELCIERMLSLLNTAGLSSIARCAGGEGGPPSCASSSQLGRSFFPDWASGPGACADFFTMRRGCTLSGLALSPGALCTGAP